MVKNIFNLTNFCIFIFIIIVIFVSLKLYIGKTYYSYYPGIPLYPNNKSEVEKVRNYIRNRSQNDIEFFYKTNKSVVTAFLPHVDESKEELSKIIFSIDNLILFLKYLFNRARPNEIDSSIKPINTDTAQTPAFPAGHAFQAYYLSNYLSKKYPDKKKIFKKIAKECDLTRVKAGLHYPSDGEFAEYFVNTIFQ